ncbi:MAG: transcriptional regulator [Oscillospiraceae bacterium]|nr:transcriptional regulator [Oscillospiraceae bacterium]
MFDKLFKKKTSSGEQTLHDEEREYTRYAMEVERTLTSLEARLHTSDDPEEIAKMTLKAACEFYQGDWAGILEVDLDLNIWTPFWWYNTHPNDKTIEAMHEFESSEYLYRWVAAMRDNHAIVVPDAGAIKDEWPGEYDIYKRLDVRSVIGVPVKPRPVAFLVVRNPKRYIERTSMLQMLAFVVLTTVNEKKLLDSVKLIMAPDSIQTEKDIIINFFGNMEIITSKGVLREQDFKSPKAARVITYLMLHRKAAHPPIQIAEALWPDDTYDPDAIGSNIRGFIYRFRQAFSLVSDYQLIESTPNGYRINPELRIMTDLQQFDKLYEAAQKPLDAVHKEELLKQAYMLYKGHIFENACDEPWIINLVNSYSLRYVGLVNELLAVLAAEKDYPCLQVYATHALELTPGNMRAYYWLIFSMYQMGAVEMAKGEMTRAKNDLTGDEYATLVKYLKDSPELPPRELFDENIPL